MARRTGQILNPHAIASSQYPWKLATETLLTATGGSLSAVGAYAHQTSKPADSTQLVCLHGLEPANTLLLKAFGCGADDGAFTARLWGLRELVGPDRTLRAAPYDPLAGGETVEFCYDHLASFAGVLGTGLVNTSSKIITGAMLGITATSTGRWADALTVSDDQTLTPPGARNFADAANAAAVVAIDFVGYSGFVFEAMRGSNCIGVGLLYAGA